MKYEKNVTEKNKQNTDKIYNLIAKKMKCVQSK